MAGWDLVPLLCWFLVTWPFVLMPDTFVRSKDEITQSTLDVCTSVLTLLPDAFSSLWRIFVVSSREECKPVSLFLRMRLKKAEKKKKKILFSAATSKLSNTERDLRTDRGKLNLNIPATFGTVWNFCELQRKRQPSHFYIQNSIQFNLKPFGVSCFDEI